MSNSLKGNSGLGEKEKRKRELFAKGKKRRKSNKRK